MLLIQLVYNRLNAIFHCSWVDKWYHVTWITDIELLYRRIFANSHAIVGLVQTLLILDYAVCFFSTLDLLADLRLLVLHEMLPKLDFKLDHFKLLFSFLPLRELFLKCWFLAYDHLLLVGAPSTILLEPFLQNQELLRQGIGHIFDV